MIRLSYCCQDHSDDLFLCFYFVSQFFFLQDMIAICGTGKYAIGEINFLTSIISKFHRNPSLVSLFMDETKLKNGSSNFELRLVDALISLSHIQVVRKRGRQRVRDIERYIYISTKSFHCIYIYIYIYTVVHTNNSAT